MVGSNLNREHGTSWTFHESDSAQAQFLRELRLLYQRSLRARTAAAGARSTGSTEQPLHTNRQHNRQAEQTTAPGAVEDDPCPTQAPPPVLLDLIFSQPTPAEAAATLAAAGAIANDTAAPRATTAQYWGADQEDSDDGTPPGMIGSSEDEEEQEEEEDYEEEDEDEVDDEQGQVEGNGLHHMVASYGTARTAQGWGSRINALTQPHPTQRHTQLTQAEPHQDEHMHDADAGISSAARSAMPAIRRAWQRANRAANTARQSGQQQLAPDIGQLLPVLQPHQRRQPAPCSLLQRGVVFSGCQTLTQLGVRRRDEQWRVTVTIQDVDHSKGYVAGTMQASNVPGSQQAIETFWEGCIIDDVNHTFYTHGWGANKHTDLQHWAKFEGWSDSMKRLVQQHSGRCGVLEQHPLIYMRWKERFFTRTGQQQCGLSIAGFYYVALNRATGELKGFYFDPSSSPFQELNMTAAHISSRPSDDVSLADAGSSSSTKEPACGLSFVSYGFA